ncbi:transcription factor SII (TFIIS) domain containing protein [Acanthamoeba castellanii str. Neff]|uniref:DNA-directed RNA polymerase I subunit RPA12 n=1 Tax=Acanthamoeba castellanii (strain ATCC 30010 / Neff) TaxID=1257118 RepID=L8GSA6_ACACF|nr:transcription factor SII (TFIIS) domain containing protein [Acanthamoeba castellanii str. Neff]ELR15006.1 transcription factor SII (TFIIS) domain containing protein [Acanthamoeba castellanii str. Neff]
MEVMIEAVRTASRTNPKKNKRAPTEWEKSFNSLAKPKTNFCDNCGCLLPLTADSQINCKMCGFNVNADELEEHVIVTKAKPKSSIRQKGKKEEDKSNDRAIIDEKCPKCGHGKMYFYTMQLRSVDEGSTVFYECVKCAYKFSQNN